MISMLIYLLVMLIVLALVWWIINQIPLPPFVRQGATILIVVIAVIFLIYMLLGLAGGAGLHTPLLR